MVRTLLLPASQTPEQMTGNALRVIRDLTGITRSDPRQFASRTLTLRASPQAISVATKLVEDLEKPVGELVLEIEVLEVNRNYARQLGITPPETSQIYSINSQQVQEAQQSLEGLVGVFWNRFSERRPLFQASLPRKRYRSSVRRKTSSTHSRQASSLLEEEVAHS